MYCPRATPPCLSLLPPYQALKLRQDTAAQSSHLLHCPQVFHRMAASWLSPAGDSSPRCLAGKQKVKKDGLWRKGQRATLEMEVSQWRVGTQWGGNSPMSHLGSPGLGEVLPNRAKCKSHFWFSSTQMPDALQVSVPTPAIHPRQTLASQSMPSMRSGRSCQ